MLLFLISHAHTEKSPDVATDRWTLSQRGIAEARELADAPFWGSVDRVVVSSEQKTLLTVADVVAQRGLPVWIDSRFDELRRGGWTADYAAQVAEVFAQPTRSVAGWETAEAVSRRAMSGLADFQVRFAGETIALIGHGMCLSIIRAAALHTSTVDFSAWQRLAFASHATVELNPLSLLSDFEIGETISR